MKTLVYDRHGDPTEVLRLVEAPDPLPGPGEVRLRLRVMTINPADLLTIEGSYGAEPEPLPDTPGHGAYGIVDAVGEGVDRLAPGDAVLPVGRGLWTDTLILDARMAVPAPAGIDPEQAAMMRANPSTADIMLRDYRDLAPGDWVVQNAANSAVGRLVARFARDRGIRTVNIVRRDGLADDLKAEGADVVLVDKGDNDLADRILAATGGIRPKLALDAVGGASTAALAASLEKGGAVVVYGLLSGEPCALDARDLVFRDITVTGFWLSDWFAKADRDAIRRLNGFLAEQMAQGRLHTEVAARYPLSQHREAMAHAAAAGRDGKILFVGE
ncbi:zinc-dependent alcohol dehydrogenase family protein [Seohaeicola zhoushanensis]|uniref:enoyl-[acyl-carrier-protein] reductase n=1 Tax=Seohaeicola zhoushanensis TaxID=1569283 RepID=A0A8J3GX20_9RHOB|nr:zinc-dependent alcohol dehydrogenase family protein [Seohaeicola zhoushanensis]GHF45588.1 trans-2-enoyl-CoA reductase [Seohaeicola zhoushanensis]